MPTLDRSRFLVLITTCLLSASMLSGMAPSPQGGGTIYFASSGLTMTMNSDGSNKTTLPANVTGEPSLGLHGGHRWFLQSRNLTGQTYPNGRTRREFFAVRDDGNTAVEVQLTNQPDLEHGYWVRWSPGDLAMSFVARRWDLGGNQIVDGGIYAAYVVFDGAGSVTGVVAPPTMPLVPVPLILWPANLGGVYAGELGPDIMSFAWSPAASQIVYESNSRTELRVATIGGSTTTILTGTWCAVPEWSPTGAPIAYTNQQSGISTVRPDGTGVTQLSKRTPNLSYSKPSWSPTGSHIAYDIWDGWGFPYPYDVGRMTAAGKSKTSLTSSLAAGGALIGWR